MHPVSLTSDDSIFHVFSFKVFFTELLKGASLFLIRAPILIYNSISQILTSMNSNSFPWLFVSFFGCLLAVFYFF